MNQRLAVVALLVASLLLAGLPEAAPPTPGPEGQPTGFDIAVVGIGTTGPNGEPHDNTAVFTFQNTGARPLNRRLSFTYKSNGQAILFSSIQFSLQPGQRHVWTGGATDRGFAPYGATLEVTVDYQDELREDNEQNNTKSKKLLDPRKNVKRPRP